MKKWFVYILKCANNTLYTGVTTDIERRFKEHTKSTLGAKYTKANKPTEVVYKKQFKDRSSAQIEEARIKKLTKEQKQLLITEDKPR